MLQMPEKKDNAGKPKMIEIGRLCVKTAGRDAGLKAVVVEVIDKNNVLIAGQTRKRKCSISHLEPLDQKVELKKGASDSDIEKVISKLGLTLRKTKSKKSGERPRQARSEHKKKAALKETQKKEPKK